MLTSPSRDPGRRSIRRGALAIGLLLAVSVVAASPAKPNIILILADDLGWRELGCYGQEKIQTPHIDRLAAGGMRFNQFHAGSAVCAPSRCNLLTGVHGGHAWIRNNQEVKSGVQGRFGGQLPLPAALPNIAKTLQQNGYATGCFGKWGLGAQESTGDPLRQGFDVFFGYNCQRNAHDLYPEYLEDNGGILRLEGNSRGRSGGQYAPALIAARALEFIRRNKSKPFFLYYPTVLPHLPLQVPEEELARYRGKWPETPYQAGSYQSHESPKACYAAMISLMDRHVGRIMDLLGELGLEENTVVLFTSDNGTTHLKEQVDYGFFESVGPLRGLKGQLYEGGIRVPLVARWPGKIPPGTTSDLVAAQYDLPATLADIAGIPAGFPGDGISILPTLLGRADEQAKHDFLFWDFAGYGGQIAVRMGNWKGIKRNVRMNPDAPMELYDLGKDIGETHDLADTHPEIVRKIEDIIARERVMPAAMQFRFGKYHEAAARP
ncbi:MAG: arylsulfatase [Luteolibacter sp.]